MRTIIDLPEDQLGALDGICRRESISRAEAIRRAVDLLVRDRTASASHGAFGLWRGRRPVDGMQYQERLRREWGTSTDGVTVTRRRVGRQRSQ